MIAVGLWLFWAALTVAILCLMATSEFSRYARKMEEQWAREAKLRLPQEDWETVEDVKVIGNWGS